MERWTCHVILRPGKDDQREQKVEGDSEAEAKSAMDEWVRDAGSPGDKVSWNLFGPGHVGPFRSGEDALS